MFIVNEKKYHILMDIEGAAFEGLMQTEWHSKQNICKNNKSLEVTLTPLKTTKMCPSYGIKFAQIENMKFYSKILRKMSIIPKRKKA